MTACATPLRSRLFRSIALVLLSCAGAQGQAQDKHDPPGFVGLPQTGTIDANRVVSARHGDAASAAPSRDAPPAKDTPREAPAARETPAARPAQATAIPRGGITGVVVESTARDEQSKVPVTFGQVFAPGDLPAGAGLSGKLADGAALPLQVDVKATHPDGSVRHAVISAILPRLAPGRPLGIALVKDGRGGKGAGEKPAARLATPATTVNVTLDGERYSASSEALLKDGEPGKWLDGPLVTEVQVAAPLRNARGEAHPHLAARFAIRSYGTAGKARVDVVVENDWAYEPAPQNFTYDVEVVAGGKQVYAKQGLVHYHHARWRVLAWSGDAPDVHLRHDTGYLIASRALPNYDRSVIVSDKALAALAARYEGPNAEPMGIGAASRGMPSTGGRNDIGLLPGWGAMYLLSMDPRAKEVTLGTADRAGSWSIHYRDRQTGRPISLIDYPYMTILGNPGDTRNRKTGKLEVFPRCPKSACKTPYAHDSAHQPAFAYLPYLVTGDHYYLEELQFWAMYNVFATNPGYRKNIEGLLMSHQVRGQAWSLRTLGEAAYITPDKHPLKDDFLAILKTNLAWYNTTYTDNPQANGLGAIVHRAAASYRKNTAIAPWQDDFFTSAVGHLVDLGFKDAGPLLKWKAKFPLARMVGEGTCWLAAANYSISVRDSATAPIYNTIAESYPKTVGPEVAALPCGSEQMAAATKRKPGDMGGYSGAPLGFPSNLQPALAYAADIGGDAGRKAWERFMSRSVKPDYGRAPQFAIVPRSIGAEDGAR